MAKSGSAPALSLQTEEAGTGHLSPLVSTIARGAGPGTEEIPQSLSSW